MAIIIFGKSECPLCCSPLQADDDYMATSHFLPTGPLSRYSDAAMHRDCFKAWAKAGEFRAAFNEVGRSWPGGPRQMLEDGTVVKVDAEDLPPVVHGKPHLNISILGSPDDQDELLSALDRVENAKATRL